MVRIVSTTKNLDGTTSISLTNDVGDGHISTFEKDCPIEAIAAELVQGFNNLHTHDLALRGNPHTP